MLRKSIDEDISDVECKKIINPFYDNYHTFIEEYVMPEVIAYYLANSFYRYAMWEATFLQHFNSASDISKEMMYFTYDQWKQFISVETNLQSKVMFEILYYCGLRKGELRGLTWKNIDLVNKTLFVKKQITDRGGSVKEFQFSTPKTKSSIRNPTTK